MNHVWTVLCSRSIVDRDTGQITLVGVIESLDLVVTEEEEVAHRATLERGEIPGIPMDCTLVSFWARTQSSLPETGLYRVSLFDPDGTPCPPLFQVVNTVSLTEGTKIRTFLKLNGLPLRGPGQYTFHVEQLLGPGQWEVVTRLPYDIALERPPGVQPKPEELPEKKGKRSKK